MAPPFLVENRKEIIMEENQIQTQFSANEYSEPVNTDNSNYSDSETAYSSEDQWTYQGQSQTQSLDPQVNSENLILGKFKSVDELSKAYQELQRYQGICSEELGELRKNSTAFKMAQDNLELLEKYQRGYLNRIVKDQEKYNAPEYFQDPSFREMYKEVFKVFGEDLDTEKFVNLLEGYVSSRIFASEKKKAAKDETDRVLDSMNYSKNPKSSVSKPKKRFDEMTQQEIDDLLDELI